MSDQPAGTEASSSPAESQPFVTASLARSSGAGQPGVNRLGYRSWSGTLDRGWLRWMVIAAVGVRRAWTSSWLKRMLFLAWLPAVWFGAGFFIWEQAALDGEWQLAATQMMRGLPPSPVFDQIRESVQTGDFESSRHMVWAWLLQSFFRYPQGVLVVLVVGMVAPPLISQDIRSRAFLLYFSRPLTRGEYVLGKLATLWTFLSTVSAAPALVLYVMGVLLSPHLGVIVATWDLPFRIIAASVVLMLPTSMLALCFSSMTKESRFAAFVWFLVWILGWFTFVAATTAAALNSPEVERTRRGMREARFAFEESAWTNLSLYHTLGRVQSWVFGFSSFDEVLVPVVILVVVTLVSLLILLRRISAPMQV
jgi:ABC-2 type transport system permease protein